MLQEVFYWVFNMSITASVTGLLILLVRLWKRLPRRLTVFLWAIPFLRMTLPLGLNSPYSLMSLLSQFTTKTIIVYQPTDKMSFSMTNSVMAAESYFPITYKVNTLQTVFHVASVIWILLAVLLLLIVSMTYVSTCKEIKTARHLKGSIYISEKVKSPAVYGIVKPKIILPSTYEKEETGLVILHEEMHIRSCDNLWRLLATAIVAMHWFNPLCWLFLKEFLTDIELACDERVLVRIGEGRKKEYAFSLLENGQRRTAFTSAFGGAKIRPRMENILSFRKLTWASATVFLSLMGVMFYVLLTNAG